MADKVFKRKLAAILSADVEGYSCLMDDDEEATVRTLTAYRTAISDLVQQFRGRIVDTPGDNILAEFTSVVDAVSCAVKIQQELSERNADLPAERKMQFRIGVNLGDVIDEEERIYGDGVNIAARVESLSDAGGICISHSAYDQIKNKLKLGYKYLGEHQVKNIREPVKAYRVLTAPEFEGKLIGVKKKAAKKGWLWAAAAAIIIAVVGLAIWQFYLRRPAIEPASVENMVHPLPDKPSIAVLPFDNLSGDPKQEYFSDGITEEIITALSKTPKMFVIARHSTSTYKGKPVKINQVAEELGVQYVLEGSVRKAEDRVRITAQLIDALTGHHLWAERYDRDLKDIFALQDEITMKIINALQVELTEGEHAHLWGKGTDKLQAYLKSLQARELYLTTTVESNTLARRFAEEAIALDPEYAPPYHYLSATHFHDVLLRTTKSPEQSKKIAVELIKKAIALDDSYALAHGFLGILYTYWMRDYEKGIMEAQKGVALDPNGAHGYLYLSLSLRYAGKFAEAIEANEKAIRLNPFPPVTYYRFACMSYIGAGRYEEAIKVGKKAITVGPNDHWSHMLLAAAYSLAGRQDEANIEAKEVLRLNPKFSVAFWAKTLPYKNTADTEHLIGALLKAGLPEHPPLELPDKPSIAVLPFDNLSGDLEQEYFSDGLTEDIITSLSKIPKIFVIARNSVFTYKGKSVKVEQVSRELGVRYVLEGSVRKAGDKVRVTAQLIDGTTGGHLWAERYDRDLKEIFKIQDEITMKIISSLQVKLTEGDQARTWARRVKNPAVQEKIWKGREYIQRFNQDGNILARKMAEDIIRLEPEFAGGYELLAWTHVFDINFGWTKSPSKSLEEAFKLTEKSLSIDDSIANTHSLLAYLYLIKRQYDEAIKIGEKAVATNPNAADSMATVGLILRWAGRPEEAVEHFKKAIRLNPLPQNYYLVGLGNAYYDMGRYNEAIAEYKKAAAKNPDDLTARIGLAASYSVLNEEASAHNEASEILRIHRKFSLAYYAKAMPFKNQNDREQWINALQKAGLAE